MKTPADGFPPTGIPGQRLFSTIALMLLLTLGGCGDSTEQPADRSSTDAAATGSGKSLDKPSAAEGPSLCLGGEGDDPSRLSPGGDLELPGDFPADIPLLEGYRVFSCTAADDVLRVKYSCAIPALEGFDEYRNKLIDNGWVIGSETRSEGYCYFTAEQEGTRGLTVSLIPGEADQTLVSLSYTPKIS